MIRFQPFLVLSVVGFGISGVSVEAALAPIAGTVSIHKTCAPGITGSAHFLVRLEGVGGSGGLSEGGLVACGQTVAVPSRDEFVVGQQIGIGETSGPPGAAVAPGQLLTLTAEPQTVTFFDGPLAGPLTVQKTCAQGITGSATFAILRNGSYSESLVVNCGASSSISTFAIGDTVVLREDAPPTGAVAATDRTITLTAEPQTASIANAKPATVAVATAPAPTPTRRSLPVRLPASGGGQSAEAGLAVLGALGGWTLVSIGSLFLRRRRSS
jgi:hypothetical protein